MSRKKPNSTASKARTTEMELTAQQKEDLRLVLRHLGACGRGIDYVLVDTVQTLRHLRTCVFWVADYDRLAWTLVVNGYVNPPDIDGMMNFTGLALGWHVRPDAQRRGLNCRHITRLLSPLDTMDLFPLSVVLDGVRQWAGVLRGELEFIG